MNLNYQKIIIKIVLGVVLIIGAFYFSVVRPYQTTNKIIPTPSPSSTPFYDANKACTDGSQCQSGWCVSKQCVGYSLSPYSIGDYWSIAVTLNNKEYPISGMVTNKVAYVYLPSLAESDPAMKTLREKLCIPYEDPPLKQSGLFPVKCIVQEQTNTTLPVIPLETKESIVGCDGALPCPSPTPIPVTIDVNLPDELKGKVVAYAGANTILLGPRDWTGTAKIGTNGNEVVSLKDNTGITKISYSMVPSCDSCAEDMIEPYFDEVKFNWHPPAKPTVSPVLHTTRISPTVATYDYRSDKYGLTVRGVVYSEIATKAMKPSYEVYVMLPDDQRVFAEALINYYIKHNFPSSQ